jgi:NADH:ubiquinone oxidoreductase subunit 6 (subunit J)
MALDIVLLTGLTLAAALAVLAKDLIKAVIALAGSSLLLGIVFFRMNAPFAGVFEISVVAGLITVLFILTIALTKTDGEVQESKKALWIFPLFFVLFVAVDALVMKGLTSKIAALPAVPETGAFGDVLWKQRTFDLIGQLAVTLSGVFAVLALFRKRDKDE